MTNSPSSRSAFQSVIVYLTRDAVTFLSDLRGGHRDAVLDYLRLMQDGNFSKTDFEPLDISAPQGGEFFAHRVGEVRLVMQIKPDHTIAILAVRYHTHLSLADSHDSLLAPPTPHRVAWSGTYEGRSNEGTRYRLEVRGNSRGKWRVRLFEETNGRMPAFPRVDRIISSSHETESFRFLEQENDYKELWIFTLVEENSIQVDLQITRTDTPAAASRQRSFMLTRC